MDGWLALWLTHTLDIRDEIIGQGQYLQTACQCVQILHGLDAVVGQAEVLEVHQCAQSPDDFYVVEGEVEPLQLDQSVQPSYFLDDVIVQLQLAQVAKLPQVLNAKDI